MSDAAPLIDARGIHTYYGVSHILHGVDFTVRRGETVGLMGRNGMGKTTLLRSVLGLVRPRAGDARRGRPRGPRGRRREEPLARRAAPARDRDGARYATAPAAAG